MTVHQIHTLSPQYLFTYTHAFRLAVVLVVACAWVTIAESQTIDHLICCHITVRLTNIIIHTRLLITLQPFLQQHWSHWS